MAVGKEQTQFRPGTSGNPGGKAKGFPAQIQKYCGKDYGKIAQGFALIAFGTDAECKTFFRETIRRATKDRLIALRELRDSGPGKPSQPVSMQGNEALMFVLPPGTTVKCAVDE